MFRRTKKFLVILLTIILVLTNIGTACFAEEYNSYSTPRTIKSIHAGGDYSVILYDDGTVSTFGENDGERLER